MAWDYYSDCGPLPLHFYAVKRIQLGYFEIVCGLFSASFKVFRVSIRVLGKEFGVFIVPLWIFRAYFRIF